MAPQAVRANVRLAAPCRRVPVNSGVSVQEKIVAKLKDAKEAHGLTSFILEFLNESDRACVVLGAAKVDQFLGQILKASLAPNTSRSDELFEGMGPLSSFSAKILLCHRLGLINGALARALHLLRRLRNDFAHETSGSSLCEGSHRDRVVELCRPFQGLQSFREFPMPSQPSEKERDESIDFRAAMAVMLLTLEELADSCSPLVAPHVAGLEDVRAAR